MAVAVVEGCGCEGGCGVVSELGGTVSFVSVVDNIKYRILIEHMT